MKNDKLVFSIIVPAYNSATFIKKCIESVLTQTYSEWELILIDDGSTDDTLNICKWYEKHDARVKVFHQKNGGHTSARNAGLKNATGEYVIFLDSDDWIAERTVESCYNEILNNNPDIIVYKMKNSDYTAPYTILLNDGCYEIEELERNYANNFIISKEGKFIFPKSLSAKCFRYDIIYTNQINVPQKILIGEDGAAFVGAILKARRVSVIANKEACYYCLVRSNSVSRSADIAAFEKATILLLYYNVILKNTKVDYSAQFNRYVVARMYTAALLVIRSGGSVKQLNSGLDFAMKNPVILNGFKKAKFSLKGYKFIIKKFILRFRLWRIAKLFDW